MTDTTVSVPRTSKVSRRRAGIALAAVAAASLAWGVIETLLGTDLRAPQMGSSPGMDIGFPQVAIAAAVASLAAWLSLVAVERWSARPRRVWSVLAGAAFLLSLGGPLNGEGIEVATRMLLLALHVVVAAVLIPGLARTTEGDGR